MRYVYRISLQAQGTNAINKRKRRASDGDFPALHLERCRALPQRFEEAGAALVRGGATMSRTCLPG